jgi:hypothetical protein
MIKMQFLCSYAHAALQLGKARHFKPLPKTDTTCIDFCQLTAKQSTPAFVKATGNRQPALDTCIPGGV